MPNAGKPDQHQGRQAQSQAANQHQTDEPGEGNHAADRRYREATERFIKEGNVEPAAKEARRAVDDQRENEELQEAERIGRSRAADTDGQDKSG